MLKSQQESIDALKKALERKFSLPSDPANNNQQKNQVPNKNRKFNKECLKKSSDWDVSWSHNPLLQSSELPSNQ